MSIFFHADDIEFNIENKREVARWITDIIKRENKKKGNINIIFTSDSHLKEINNKFLDRDYYTDVISFNYSEKEKISGDIYISIDTVKLNSKKYNTGFEQELLRVIVHGLLHLIGYDDQNKEAKKGMKKMEDYYLNMYDRLKGM